MIPVRLGKLKFPLFLSALTSFFCRGGMKESGIGRENGIEAFEACTQWLHRSCGLTKISCVQILKANPQLSTWLLLMKLGQHKIGLPKMSRMLDTAENLSEDCLHVSRCSTINMGITCREPSLKLQISHDDRSCCLDLHSPNSQSMFKRHGTERKSG